MLELFKRMWARQNALVRGLMKAQTAILMGVAYVVGVGPVALGFRIVGRSAIARPAPDRGASTYWISVRDRPQGMDAATRRW